MSVFVGWQNSIPKIVANSKDELNLSFLPLEKITEEECAEVINGEVLIGEAEIAAVKYKLYAKNIRSERDRRLAETDYLLMPDYPLKEEERNGVIIYRQQLRDLPQKKGFPWRGANDPSIPWPVKVQTGASAHLNTEAVCA